MSQCTTIWSRYTIETSLITTVEPTTLCLIFNGEGLILLCKTYLGFACLFVCLF
jgi:hypothetical protein